MKRCNVKSITCYGFLLMFTLSCMEVTPIKPKEYLSVCTPLPIETNIVGEWSYVSTYNLLTKTDSLVITKGKITFTSSGQVIDPDSLFENHPDGKTIVSKVYYIRSENKIINHGLSTMNVELHTAGYGRQTNFFQLISNECNQIKFNDNKNKVIGFTLTRL